MGDKKNKKMENIMSRNLTEFKLWNSQCATDEDWNISFYAQYMKLHPEKFLYEGIKEKLNAQTTHDILFHTYYGNTILRCVPVLDFINNRYIEMNYQSNEADTLIDSLNGLFRFHHNPVSYVYNALLYYNSKFENAPHDVKKKKQRLLKILTSK